MPRDSGTIGSSLHNLGRVGATLEQLRPGPAPAGLLQVIRDGHE